MGADYPGGKSPISDPGAHRGAAKGGARLLDSGGSVTATNGL